MLTDRQKLRLKARLYTTFYNLITEGTVQFFIGVLLGSWLVLHAVVVAFGQEPLVLLFAACEVAVKN